MASDNYTSIITGSLGSFGTHRMCRRCGALIGPKDYYPEGATTPEMAHDAFHATIDVLLARERNS